MASFMIRSYQSKQYTKTPSTIKVKNIEVNNISLKTPEGPVQLKVDTVGKLDQVLVKTSDGFKWKDIQKISNVNVITADQEADLNLLKSSKPDSLGLTLSFINARKGDLSLTDDHKMVLKYNIKYKVSYNVFDYYLKFYSNDVEIYSKFLGVSIVSNEPTAITDGFIVPLFKETDVITCKITTDEDVTEITENNISKISALKGSYYELIIL
jgi:hypothetical protein